jgi:hypothetical protein
LSARTALSLEAKYRAAAGTGCRQGKIFARTNRYRRTVEGDDPGGAAMTTPDDVVPEDNLDPEERDIEAPPEDVVEQATPADPADERVTVHRGLEVSEYDAAESARVVELDDDYR